VVEQGDGQQHDRQRHEDDQRQRQVHLREDDEADHQVDAGDQKLLRAMMGELGHVKQVAGDARHDLADFCLAVIGKGQLRQVGEEVGAHVPLHLGAHDVSLGLHIITAASFQQQEPDVGQAQFEHDVQRDAAKILYRKVGDPLDDQRKDQRAHCGQHSAQQVHGQDVQVRFVVGDKAPDQRPGAAGILPGGAH